MPDPLLSADDYAEIRGAITETLPDDAVIEQVTETHTPNGPHKVYTQRSTSKAAVLDLSWQERARVEQLGLEVSAKVRLEALTPVEHTDRIKVTNWETGAVRTFQVEGFPQPSREFFRDTWCKEFL